MKKLDVLISKLKSLEDEILQVIESVVREYDYIILDMNAQDQLYEKGITRTGQEISSYAPYAPLTIEIKQSKGQPTGRVTLRDEGDFHRSFELEFNSDGFTITASDWKTEKLMFEYGDEILGLTDDNFKEFAQSYVAPEIHKYLKAL